MTAKRPTLDDKETKHAAYALHADAFTDWLHSMGMDVTDTTTAYSILALEESADAFEAGCYLQSLAHLPMTMEGVRILDKIYSARTSVLTELVEKWVIANCMRIKGKLGQDCTFKVGDAKITGSIAAIIHREARLIVEVRQSANKSVNMSVNAEDVVKIADAYKHANPNTPTGGTPVAVAA